MAGIDPEQIETAEQLRAGLVALFHQGGWAVQRLAAEARLGVATVQGILDGSTALPHTGTLKAFVTACGQDPAPWVAARGRAVQADKAPPARVKRTVIGVMPLAADCFQEREAAAQIAAELKARGGVVLSGVLSGMGGVGKTQLAAAHARASSAEVVVWATAATRQGIIGAYADAAILLRLPGAGEDPERNAARFLEWTASTATSWLIVLDDIQDPDHVRRLWPPTDRAGQVLATSRLRDEALRGQGRRRIDIDLYAAAEARSYLKAKLAADDRTETDTDLNALADDLGRLPLALAQAAAYLIESGRTITDYRRRFADHKRRLADLFSEKVPDDYEHVVAAAWALSIEQANCARPAGLARPVLELLSVLDANGIPQSVLTAAPALTHLGSPEADEVTDALRVLHRFNLASHNPAATRQEVRVHQLIQRATRDTLTTDQLTATAQTAADALEAVWPQVENGPLGGILRANTTALTAATGDALWQDEVHRVLFTAARTLGETGQVHGAISAYEDLHARTFSHHGPDHPDALNTRNHLARWRGEAGDAAGAATEFASLLTDHLRILGPDHPGTLVTRHHLARWRGEAGDAAAAATAYADLLPEYERILGPDHPDTLATRHHLARWRGEAGDAAAAATEFAKLLPKYLRILGPDHPDTLATRHHLAYWQGEAGDAAAAATAYADLLTDQERILGCDHPHTLATRNNLAYWRGMAGDAAAAATEFADLLTDRLRILGPDHPDTLITWNNLAYWRGMAGDAAGAATEFAKLLTDHLRILGPDHPHTLDTRHNLAHWRGMAGDAAAAATAYADLLTDHLRILGPDHPHTLDTRLHLAHWRGESGEDGSRP